MQTTNAAAEHDHTAESRATTPFDCEPNAIAEMLTHRIATIGGNMQLRRVEWRYDEKCHVSGRAHTAAAPGLGCIGVPHALDARADSPQRNEIFRKCIACCCHKANCNTS